MDSSLFRDSNELITALNDAGLIASRAEQLSERWFHHNHNKKKFSMFRELSEEGNASFMSNKPHGGLWLSPGTFDSFGKLSTDWQKFTENFDWEPSPSCFEVVLRDDAVVLELNEENLDGIGRFLGEDFAVTAFGMMGLSSRIDFNASPEKMKQDFDELLNLRGVSWIELRDAGVGAVLVDGKKNRDFFWGWDIRSVVVLDKSAIASHKRISD